jgi:hypothetical protein
MSSVNEPLASRPSTILCADWGKESAKRAVYLADVDGRVVRRVPGEAWSLARLLEEAQRFTSIGSVLVTVDAPLGVPESYLAALNKVRSGQPLGTFLDLLASISSMPRFFDGTSVPEEWRLDCPFFAVPRAADGGLSAYVDAAASRGVSIRRSIDVKTAAKSVFIKSGIPGSVGSAACALWQELAPLLRRDRTFTVWPFEGDLQMLLRTSSVVVGEIYPRAAYATALLPMSPISRSRLSIAKTDAGVRRQAIASLREAGWIHSLGVKFENLAEAEAGEDDFDACLTAAALVRCVLEGSPLEHADDSAARAEGGMLGTGSINLDLVDRKFGNRVAREQRAPDRLSCSGVSSRRSLTKMSSTTDPLRTYSCPIAGCDKVYRGSRGGWDAHVGSLRIHPSWHPELQSEEDRKQMYRTEFPDFFR